MISSELPEILRMSHRIVVMCEGRVTGTLDGGRGHAGERHALRDAAAGREPEDAAELELADARYGTTEET